MAITDAAAVIDALADPQALYVFGVLAVRTSGPTADSRDGTRSTPYLTPFGMARETSLPRDVIDAAIERLKRAGLLETLVDDERGYESWRVSEAALRAAAGRRAPAPIAVTETGGPSGRRAATDVGAWRSSAVGNAEARGWIGDDGP